MNFDNDLHDDEQPEREISLGTGTILGIFFALALVCAAFFGFGYSMGRHSGPAAIPPAAKPGVASDTKADSPFSDFKAPPTGNSSARDAKPDADAAEPGAAEQPAATKATATPQTAKPSTPPAHAVAFPVPSQPSGETPSVAAGQFVVQVSAPSRQGDADALLAALEHKGYRAFIRKEPQDSYFHVQIGPFGTRQDAQAMMKRLDADGYKPFIK